MAGVGSSIVTGVDVPAAAARSVASSGWISPGRQGKTCSNRMIVGIGIVRHAGRCSRCCVYGTAHTQATQRSHTTHTHNALGRA